jgi:hypothetical protein
MTLSRPVAKYERVTVTLVPETTDRSLLQIPTTYNPLVRNYSWKSHDKMQYMLVPTRISNREIKIDVFVESKGRGRVGGKDIQVMVEHFVRSKIAHEWRGLRFGSVGKAMEAEPPSRAVVRGSIEEILGVQYEK